jgi:hypothetical protein
MDGFDLALVNSGTAVPDSRPKSSAADKISNWRQNTMKYYDSIIGHAPGHLRDALLDVVEQIYYQGEDVEIVKVGWDEEPKPLQWLLGQLWNCTDFLPGDYGDLFDDRGVGTYGIAARQVALGLDPPFEPDDVEGNPYLLQCEGCGEWTLGVEHYYSVRHGPYWTQYSEWGELDYQCLDDVRVTEWSDCEASQWSSEDWEVDDDELEYMLENRDVEVGDFDEYYLTCTRCRHKIDVTFYDPDAYLCQEVRRCEPGTTHWPM